MVSGARERGPRGVTRPGARGFHAATSSRGLRKLRCLLPGKGRPFQSRALAQPAVAVYLASRSSQHTPTCSWELQELQCGCPGHRAWLPSAPRPCSLPLGLGRNYSLSFRSGWRGCSGCSWHRLLKASHPSGASREAGSFLSTLIRPPRSGPGTVYWTGLEGFGFPDVSSAVDGCCF